MGVIGMSKMFEDFLSSRWNIYGLQVLASSLIIMILGQYISIIQLCIVGLCVFLISFCQRLLGIKFGMLFYEQNQDKIGGLLDEIRKLNERDTDE